MKKIISAINDLIEVIDNRIKGYDIASKETKEFDLKNIFHEIATKSKKLKKELIPIVLKYGGKIEKGTNDSGKVYKAWMDIKTALTGKNRKAILNSCEFGEDVAYSIYKSTLRNNKFPSGVKSVIEKQKTLLKIDHDKIKTMRDLAMV